MHDSEKNVTDPSSQPSSAVVCSSQEKKRFDDVGRIAQGVINKAKKSFVEDFHACDVKKNQPKKIETARPSEATACCYECGRPGVVVRKRRRRGRFRWVDI